jgi:hypothetical protein
VKKFLVGTIFTMVAASSVMAQTTCGCSGVCGGGGALEYAGGTVTTFYAGGADHSSNSDIPKPISDAYLACQRHAIYHSTDPISWEPAFKDQCQRVENLYKGAVAASIQREKSAKTAADMAIISKALGNSK